ncbi:ABC transporter ATP-binding protein [Phytohabitans houttuyneae]|uniref:ABC transporter n=1 Tax=Phytohabitans houttuyneae TaxID=1076126 RepID=A0A6V8K531_9ACTN|nr:ABC transporter ATP-binding protein [Phytohabitans houttuyneae]GFJ78844.1 ABC transporter [Phytohabitans houttuyneae]
MTVLEAVSLTKRFGPVTAVDGVSFGVGEGEIVGLLGPNGAGKTTTLHMVLGLTTPDTGTIRMFGRDLARHRAWALARVNFAASYVSLPWVLRVDELLDVFAHMYGLRHPARQVAQMMELLELGELRDRRYGQLSSGQQTRVQLAKALLNEPGLLVLDEPTANLDPDVGDRIRELLLREAHRTGRAMLITSHNMPEVERMCSRIHFVSGGRIVATGSAVELAGEYGVDDLEAVFLRVARG